MIFDSYYVGPEDGVVSTFLQLFSEKGVGRWPFIDKYKNITFDIEYVIAQMLAYQVQPIFMVLTSRTDFGNGTSILTISVSIGKLRFHELFQVL